ncbi:MAG: thioesterase [Clostridium sp.]|nr:thioesterase [Clostridium sp.]
MESLEKCVLFCLPFAGGSARCYLPWKRFIDRKIEIVPVELAGRGSRLSEKKYITFEQMADDSFEYIAQYLKSNNVNKYAIFGHSMGSWVVYEIYRRIKENNINMPIHIIFSGNSVPFAKYSGEKIHDLPKDEFINKILELGGASEQVLYDEKIGNMLVDILRNDYTLIEEYECKDDTAIIECDISVFNGMNDNIKSDDLVLWKNATQKTCEIYNFEGGHFFIDSSREKVVKTIERILLK